MSKKNLKERFDDGFKGGMNFLGINSIGDFFACGFRGGLKAIKAIFELMFKL